MLISSLSFHILHYIKLHEICLDELLRRINNLFCSRFDLLYLILFILTFWLGNFYQQIVLKILITLVYFFVGNFIKLVKKIPKIVKIFNIIYVTKIQYTLNNLVHQWSFLINFFTVNLSISID